MHAHKHAHAHTHTPVHTHMHAHKHAHTHTPAHTHTHTHLHEMKEKRTPKSALRAKKGEFRAVPVMETVPRIFQIFENSKNVPRNWFPTPARWFPFTAPYSLSLSLFDTNTYKHLFSISSYHVTLKPIYSMMEVILCK